MLIHPFTLPGLLDRGGDGYISSLFFRFFPSLSFRQSHSLTHSSLLLFLSLLLLLDRRSRGMSDREIASLSPSLLSPFLSPSPSPAQPIAQDRHNGIRQLGPKYPTRPTDRQTGGRAWRTHRTTSARPTFSCNLFGRERKEGRSRVERWSRSFLGNLGSFMHWRVYSFLFTWKKAFTKRTVHFHLVDKDRQERVSASDASASNEQLEARLVGAATGCPGTDGLSAAAANLARPTDCHKTMAFPLKSWGTTPRPVSCQCRYEFGLYS